MKQKKGKVRFCVAVALLLTALLASSLLTGSGGGQTESIKTVMRDAVLHEENRIGLFGVLEVNPAVISDFVLTGLLLGVAALGLDAVPIEGFDAAILDEEFGLKEKGYTSLVVVPVGHHSVEDFNATLPKSRLPQNITLTEV